MSEQKCEITHENEVIKICNYACQLLRYPKLNIEIMHRLKPVTKGRGYVLGYTNLKKNLVVLDVYTARLRKPKKISAILNVLAHEITHHQRPPYRQWHRGRWIIRQHYPRFYKQVNKNIVKIKKDKILKQYFA